MDAPLQTPLTFISQRPSGRQYIPDGAPLTMHHMSQRHPPETTVEERTTLPWLHSSQKMEECQDPRNLQMCPVSYCHILIHFWGNELWCSPGITGVPSSTSMATAKLWWLSTSGCKLCCSSKTAPKRHKSVPFPRLVLSRTRTLFRVCRSSCKAWAITGL